jgi:hypothetical protein
MVALRIAPDHRPCGPPWLVSVRRWRAPCSPRGLYGGKYLIQFKSSSQGVDKFQGVRFMLAWLTEAIDDWSIVVRIISRLRDWPQTIGPGEGLRQ